MSFVFPIPKGAVAFHSAPGATPCWAWRQEPIHLLLDRSCEWQLQRSCLWLTGLNLQWGPGHFISCILQVWCFLHLPISSFASYLYIHNLGLLRHDAYRLLRYLCGRPCIPVPLLNFAELPLSRHAKAARCSQSWPVSSLLSTWVGFRLAWASETLRRSGLTLSSNSLESSWAPATDIRRSQDVPSADHTSDHICTHTL